MTTRLKFQVFKRWRVFKGIQFYWRLRGGNNEIIAQSEGYQNAKDCRKTIDLIVAKAEEALIEWNG